MYGFSCNVEILNNHHKTLLISWNSWTPIKLILVAKNEMIGDFLSTLESSGSSFTNHLINSKYKKKWSENPKSNRFTFGSLGSYLVFYATSRL
jgi:hypothetical protein